MKNMKSKVLFISHEASRTGAPLFLLNILRWLKNNSDISFQVLLKKDGELKSEFEAIAPVYVLQRSRLPNKTILQKTVDYIASKPRIRKIYSNQIKEKLKQNNIKLIYSNTITNGNILDDFSSLKCPVICHVHELKWTIDSLGLKSLNLVKQYTDCYIAVSETVKRNLIENYAIPQEKIETIHGAIPTREIFLAKPQQMREQICQQLNISTEAKIVCGVGTIDWRKGTDLFIQLARSVFRYHLENPVYFLWIGGQQLKPFLMELQYDIKTLGLEESIRFLGIKSNPLDYMAACDVFALVSREDPFPLVCLEAASLGKPIVCFDKAGGASEFIENDCGFVIPYLDIEAMATKVVHLLRSPELCQRIGQRSQQKVYERHTMEVVAPKILKMIEKFLN
jgi:glycosyltransferase involved in cell wall biosynthesis